MSDLETILAFQLRAAKVKSPVREHKFHPSRRWRFDFCWIDQKLAVEVQGGTWSRGSHGRGSGIARDYEKNNAAVLLGWRVMYFTGDMIKSGEALNDIEYALK